MVQVRCPECGFLQSLSEERFVAISEDYLNCPHCHAKVPKEWRPAPGETVPEETRHKVLAFSRRILNGRNVAREVVYALESLVRHYGAMDESDKALGVGYTLLGEYKKAEEFLIRALSTSPDDAQILHSLMETFLELERFEEAVHIGRKLVQAPGSRAQHEDVGRLALALKGAGRSDEAQQVLDTFPDLDPHHPVVKHARKEINRTKGRGLGSLLGVKGKIRRLLEGASKIGMGGLGAPLMKRATSTPKSGEPVAASMPESERTPPAVPKKGAGMALLARVPVLMEYWVYAGQSRIPQWEDIRNGLAEQFEDLHQRERVFHMLESFVKEDDLAIEYILKKDAPELFDYPDDMIPHNAKDFGEEDRKTLMEAEMIVRVRLSLDGPLETDYVTFMVRFVESVRVLTSGVVQDAVSHALWGIRNWIANVVRGGKSVVEAHVLLEILDEDGLVWMHTHGMQKFGLPDLEMEGIPVALIPACRKVMGRAIEALLSFRDREIDLQQPLRLGRVPFPVQMTFHPQDQEGHFPVGSLRLLPHIPGQDPADPSTLEQAVSLLSAPRPQTSPETTQERPHENDIETKQEIGTDENELRGKLLDAHQKARKSLPLFKRSFQEKAASDPKIHAVKVGFPVQGGQYEWMWVSVGGWRGGALVGHLENVPVLRKDLQHGGVVQIGEEEIFDWLISQDGHISQGAYTEGILTPQ